MTFALPVKNREVNTNFRSIRIGDLRLDIERQTVTRDGINIAMAGLSFRLLKVMADNWPAAVSRRKLAQGVWGDVVVSDDTVRQRVRLLRQSLGESDYISAVKGIGYRLAGPVKTANLTGQKRVLLTAASIVAVGLIAFLMLNADSNYSLIHEIKHLIRH